MPRHPLTVEDLWNMPRVGAPAPAPNGKQVIVPVTTFSMERNEGTTRLWLVPGDAKEAGSGRRGDRARPLTAAETSSSQPSVSPDGKRMLFVRKPGGPKNEGKGLGPRYPDQPQLYLLSFAGGEPERLTDLPLGVIDPRWFPDGKRVAFAAVVYRDALSLEETAKRAKEIEENPVKVRVSEDRLYRFWDRWLTDGKVHHIFVLDLETRALFDLIPDSRRWLDLDDPTHQYDISPDGREVAFSACRSTPPHDPISWGVFTVPVPEALGAGAKAGKVQAITPKEASHAYRPMYSPDGRHIVLGIQREIDFYADRVRLVAYDRKSRKHKVLTEKWDLSAEGWSFGADARTIFLRAEVEGRTALFTLDLPAALRNPKSRSPREIIRGGVFGEPRIAGRMIFTTYCSLQQPPEIAVCGLDGKKARQLTSFTRAALEQIQLSEVEEIVFTGAENHSVQMFLVYPPGERAGLQSRGAGARRYPLVQVVHGGPHAASADDWHWRWNAQAFAAPGYLLAMVNFHGSTGWGQRFAASILGRWGDQPYADVMAATDLLIERGLADPNRMAAAGGSYGGYLVSWIASQTDRFAAIVNHAGVCDFHTQYASDWTQGRARAMGGEPWKNIEGMDRFNPMRHASGFRSPMLVIHGEQDYRVPYTQGIEIYNVYKAMKKPARLVCYPDENHWILKPQNSRYWYGEVLGWLDRWLGKGERPPGRGGRRTGPKKR